MVLDFFTWECWYRCFSSCLTTNFHGLSIKLVVSGFPPWQMGGDASNDDSNNMYSPEVSAASTQNNSQGKTSSPSLYYLEAWQVSLLSQTLAFKLVAITYFSFFVNECLMWTIQNVHWLIIIMFFVMLLRTDCEFHTKN